jgi:hypothetical protein
MALSDSFEEFIGNLEVKNIEYIVSRFKKITKRLNEDFHQISGDDTSNGFVVGSLGRGTAIDGISDLDMIFEMPVELYYKYSAYQTNGQSSFLQAVKDSIKKTYPSTIVRGDGQVVVIDFASSNDFIEVCPCFRNDDDSFTYPDSNNGGKWKKTNPLPEQEATKGMTELTGNVFIHLCQMIRVWKCNHNIKMNGLLIDSLVYKFLSEHDEYYEASFEDYLSLIRDYFSYVADLNKNQEYWYALGSNQRVYNKDEGQFIEDAKKAFDKLSEIDVEKDNIFECLTCVFGGEFPTNKTIYSSFQLSSYDLRAPSEEFIDLDYSYPIRITNNLKIEGLAKSPSNRRKYLTQTLFIGRGCSLKFYIDYTDAVSDFRVFWKVRNRGKIAERKSMLRGEIKESISIEETSDFFGSHFVECYIVKNNVCIAKDRIAVNIMKSQAY